MLVGKYNVIVKDGGRVLKRWVVIAWFCFIGFSVNADLSTTTNKALEAFALQSANAMPLVRMLKIGEDTKPPTTTSYSLQGSRGEWFGEIDGFTTMELQITIRGLKSGDTVYAYAEGYDGFDPVLSLVDGTFSQIYATDDDGGGELNSLVIHTIDADGDYIISLVGVKDSYGRYRLAIGINDEGALGIDSIKPTVTLDCRFFAQSKRPVLSGYVQKREDELFIIHYTLQGIDATSRYYVERLEEALRQSIDVQLNLLGWRLPPPDCEEGGDNRIDVYVLHIDNGTLGYAMPEVTVGDNPNTDAIELYSSYGYLVIENDMQFTDSNSAIDIMQVTAAHELHHVIQFGYDGNETFGGLVESGASWIETLVYPEIAEVYDYVDDIFASPDLCLGAEPRNFGTRIYAEWVVLDSLARDFGVDTYRQIWERLVFSEGLVGFYEALNLIGTSPEDVMQRTWVRLLLHDFEYWRRFNSTVDVEEVIDGVGTLVPQRDGVQQLGVDYIAVTAKGVFTFSQDKRALELFYVGINTQTGEARVHEIGTSGTIDTTRYDEGYLMVLNTIRHRHIDECRYEGWEITTTQGGGKPLTPPTVDIWNARNYGQ